MNNLHPIFCMALSHLTPPPAAHSRTAGHAAGTADDLSPSVPGLSPPAIAAPSAAGGASVEHEERLREALYQVQAFRESLAIVLEGARDLAADLPFVPPDLEVRHLLELERRYQRVVDAVNAIPAEVC